MKVFKVGQRGGGKGVSWADTVRLSLTLQKTAQ